MEPLTIGQAVTYVDPDGVQHAATVLEAYAFSALVAVPDLSLNVACRRMSFEGSAAQPGPYITDAPGGTDGSYEALIAEE